MTKPKSQLLGTRGPLALWEGEVLSAMPDLRDALAGTRVDSASFEQWLRPLLIEYRASMQFRAMRGQLSAVLKWLREAQAEIESALLDGRLTRLPAFYAEPACQHAAIRAGTTWAAALASGDPVVLRQILAEACASLEREPARLGRPPAGPRDRLLAAVLKRFRSCGLDQAEAAIRADMVLVAAKVPSPEASIVRAAKRGR